MVSSRSYLIRAIYDWILENRWTPYIVVAAEYEGVQVPQPYVNDGQIILNIAPQACRGLHISNDRLVFGASFSGIAYQIHVPPLAVLAIYAKENGRGMVFSEEEEEDDGGDDGGLPPAKSELKSSASRRRAKPQLKVVK